MEKRQVTTVVLASSLLFDVIAGIAVGILVEVIGAIVFVVSMATSLLTMRRIGAKPASGQGGPATPAEATVPADPTAQEAESPPDPTADPSYNPYARED